MGKTILDTYNERKAELGVDKINFDAALAAKTPYTTNDNQKIDDQVMTAAKYKVGRGGELNEKKYSDTLTKK